MHSVVRPIRLAGTAPARSRCSRRWPPRARRSRRSSSSATPTPWEPRSETGQVVRRIEGVFANSIRKGVYQAVYMKTRSHGSQEHTLRHAEHVRKLLPRPSAAPAGSRGSSSGRCAKGARRGRSRCSRSGASPPPVAVSGNPPAFQIRRLRSFSRERAVLHFMLFFSEDLSSYR